MTWKQYGTESADQIVAFDVESYYSPKNNISLSNLATWEYVFHPETAPYLISFETEDWKWVGEPEHFTDWDKLHGKVLAAHNASFDALVWQRMVRDGVIPKGIVPSRFFCTADLAAFLRVKRSLAGAVKALYDVKLLKDVRTNAKDKTKEDLKRDTEGWKRMLAYGGSDAKWCYRIAKDHMHKMPAMYQRVSEINRESAWRGIITESETMTRVDKTDPQKGGYLQMMEDTCHTILKSIPWYPDEAPLSPIATRAQGRKDGIKVPGSLSKKSVEGIAFYETYGTERGEDGELKYPWVTAIRDYRQASTMLNKLTNLHEGSRDDGSFPYTSVFFGTNTGRFAAGVGKNPDHEDAKKFNLLNLPRKPIMGVDLRGLIIPPKGYKLFLGDYAQVEPRILMWYCGDHETLRMITEDDFKIYEAMGMKIANLTEEQARGLKEKDPDTYQMVKGSTLGFGYGMGEDKFAVQAPQLTGGAYCPTVEEAREAKFRYRNANPLVVNFWRMHQSALLSSVFNKDPMHRIELASGRWLEYWDPKYVLVKDKKTKKERREILVYPTLGGNHNRLYGPKCVEHICQATGVDVLFHAWCNVADLGYITPFTLYDEIVAYVPEKTAMEDGARIAKVMEQTPDWLEGCPLEVEWKIVDRYCK